MLKIGDKVFVEDSAEEDFLIQAWAYIKEHREAVVKSVRLHASPYNPQADAEIVLEFAEPFDGGHSCCGTTKPRQGVFVMAKNVTLMFEESREVITVPQIEGVHEKEQVSQI